MGSKEKKGAVQVSSFIFEGSIYWDGEEWEGQVWKYTGTSFRQVNSEMP